LAQVDDSCGKQVIFMEWRVICSDLRFCLDEFVNFLRAEQVNALLLGVKGLFW
jgi:hypothetical protein